ncbi:MAG: WbqC family protein [Candidatus Bathyarchaeota archaeon]|nr:WbqC family protein [Candidatus Termiticorpusculum sp.]
MQTSDLFIIEDNVQFERQGFTSRNKIKTIDGIRWLSVPIKHANLPLKIKDIEISNEGEPTWASRHWLTLKHNYCKAPFWNDYNEFFEDAYTQKWAKLIDLNMHLIRGIMHFLDIKTPLVIGSTLDATGQKNELIIAQCKAVGGDTQLAGIGGKHYINPKRFEEEGIKLCFQNFQHPCYMQLHGKFASNLSVVDFLFCSGADEWKKITTTNRGGPKNVDK